jgi:hypothetical protein
VWSVVQVRVNERIDQLADRFSRGAARAEAARAVMVKMGEKCMIDGVWLIGLCRWYLDCTQGYLVADERSKGVRTTLYIEEHSMLTAQARRTNEYTNSDHRLVHCSQHTAIP